MWSERVSKVRLHLCRSSLGAELAREPIVFRVFFNSTVAKRFLTGLRP